MNIVHKQNEHKIIIKNRSLFAAYPHIVTRCIMFNEIQNKTKQNKIEKALQRNTWCLKMGINVARLSLRCRIDSSLLMYVVGLHYDCAAAVSL